MRNPDERKEPLASVAAMLSACGQGGPPLEEQVSFLQTIRSAAPEFGVHIDSLLLRRHTEARSALHAAKEAQSELRELVEKVMAPPYFPASFQGPVQVHGARGAMVQWGGERRAVMIGPGIDPGALEAGDEVLLSQERNCVLALSDARPPQHGETAHFERSLADGRVVVRSRDEELVVTPARALRETALKAGDLLRFDRITWIAFEKIERSQGEQYFLEETPPETFEDVGGLDREIAQLQRIILLHFTHGEIVRKYGLRRKKAALMHGPPGSGKTLTARALANWLAQLSPARRSRFINVKPGALHSMWYGQTEANYREVFRVAREAGEAEPEIPVVIFFDEVDAVGLARGQSLHRIDDRVLNAFMAELEGLEERGNILVVTATNRPDALDAALLRPGRLGDLILRIPRPNRKATSQIFRKHLPPGVPYAQDGLDGAQARERIIDSAVSRVFAANGEGEVAKIMFRDGKTRAVRAAELISGAAIAGISQTALERACTRETEGGPPGVRLEDIFVGVEEFLNAATRTLTPANCRSYLDDLPQDVDVVRVEPLAPKARRSVRYLNVA